jgi:hypothetical protein
MDIIKRGNAAPKSVYAAIFADFAKEMNKMQGVPNNAGIGWIVDGFPRTRDQADVVTHSKMLPDHIILLHDGNLLLSDLSNF